MTPSEMSIFVDLAKELLYETEQLRKTKDNGLEVWVRSAKIHRLSGAINALSDPRLINDLNAEKQD